VPCDRKLSRTVLSGGKAGDYFKGLPITNTISRVRKLVSFSGTKTFLELLEEVGLPNPFVAENLKVISDSVTKWLEK